MISRRKPSMIDKSLGLLVLFYHFLSYLGPDDSEKVPPNDKLLSKAVVFFRLEGNSEEAHYAGVAGQV